MTTIRQRLHSATSIFSAPMVLAATLSLAIAAPVSAANNRHKNHQQTFTDYARVINVDPIYKRVAIEKPRRECWVEEQHHATVYEGQNSHHNQRPGTRRSTGDTLAGGVIGGVIGNQLSRRSSNSTRIGATVVGAIIGSAIANESGGKSARHRRHRPQQYKPVRRPAQSRPVERCTTHITTEYQEQISGYQVTYRYQGQTFNTRTQRDPGDRIPVRISIRPQYD